MFARKFRAGVAVTALVTSGLALAGPAFAEPTGPAGTNDYVGVGSDTTQIVMQSLADAYNTANPSSPHIFSFDACIQSGTTCTPGGNVTIRSGVTIARPNGSGAGKALLYGTGNNTSVDFARSSSGLSTAEFGAGLQAIPFAVDSLVTVVSSQVSSDAPSALSIDEVLGIYNGTFTNWAQLGGNNAPIHPYIPQTGSGTRTYFLAQLQAANGGVAPTLASNVVETQEHDPTKIQGDRDAIAPFSLGRATTGTAGPGLVRVEQGWLSQRAVYNVVRSNASSALLAAMASFCDPSYKNTIETAGFKQMAVPASQGACGTPAANGSTSNFTTTSAATLPASSTTSLALSPSVRAFGSGSNAVVNVSGSNGAATGIVALAGRGFNATGGVSNGQATIAIPSSLTPGSYPVRAYYSGSSAYQGSSASGTLTVTKANSGMSVTVKLSKVKKRKHHKAKKPTTYTATVRVLAAGVTPTGAVVVKKGSKTLGVGSVRNGVATIKFKITKLKKGKRNKLTVTYLGDGNVNAVAKFVTVKRKK